MIFIFVLQCRLLLCKANSNWIREERPFCTRLMEIFVRNLQSNSKQTMRIIFHHYGAVLLLLQGIAEGVLSRLQRFGLMGMDMLWRIEY